MALSLLKTFSFVNSCFTFVNSCFIFETLYVDILQNIAHIIVEFLQKA